MDANRFDRLSVAVSDAMSSRRSLVQRLAGGGVATALAAIGIGSFGTEDVEAKKKAKSCPKKCNKKAKKKGWSSKKKNACKAKCNKNSGGGAGTGGTGSGGTGTGGTGGSGTGAAGGFPAPVDQITLGATCTVGGTECGFGLTCNATLLPPICVPTDTALGLVGAACTSGANCATGFCSNIVAGVGVCSQCNTLGTTLCGAGATQQCCAIGATCDPIANVCI